MFTTAIYSRINVLSGFVGIQAPGGRQRNSVARGMRTAFGVAVGAWCLVGATGCPDVPGKLDRFTEETQEDRNIKLDMPAGAGLVDVTGLHLFAVDTVVSPGLPLQFLARTTVNADTSELTFTLIPLSLSAGSTTEPRVPLENDALDPITVVIDANGDFEADLGTLMVTGMANPLTGSDIVATLTISGTTLAPESFCGTADGDVLQPIQSPLAGSTFATIRLSEDPNAPLPSGADLPVDFPVTCDEAAAQLAG
jgi:hypothetical protein